MTFLKNKITSTFLILVNAILFTALIFIVDVSYSDFFICGIIFLMMSLWGHLLMIPLYYYKQKYAEGFIWGCCLGIPLAALIISAIVYLAGWNLLLIFLICFLLPFVLLLFIYNKIRSTSKKTSEITLFDYNISLMLLFFILGFHIFPYLNFGYFSEDKYLYAWLFGHDFINRMAHVESLSRGIPFESMFFAGETLSYYWLGYILPAMMKNIQYINIENHQALMVSQVFYTLNLTIVIFLFFKKYAQSCKNLIIAISLFAVFYSYAWLLKAFVKLSTYFTFIPESLLLTPFSGFSHGFYRFLLVEPHSIIALSLIMMILYHFKRNPSFYQSAILGLSIGLLFGVEATNGIMVMLWFCLMGLFYLYKDTDNKLSVFNSHLVSGLVAVAVYAVMFAIEMYSLTTGKGVLQLSFNMFALKLGLIYFPVVYGPPFILGLAGMFYIIKTKIQFDHWILHFVALFFVGLFFTLFIQNPTEYHFGLLKSIRIIPISLVVLSIYFINKIDFSSVQKYALFFLLAFSAPTYFTDNLIASDITHSPTFVRYDDMQAAKWIRSNIPIDAIVQADPNYPGIDADGRWDHYAYSFIPIFAQRKTAVGEWKVSHQEHSRPEDVFIRFHSIKEMYNTSDLSRATQVLDMYNIKYVYVGKLERNLYSVGVIKFHDERYFNQVYENNSVKIYRYEQGLIYEQ